MRLNELCERALPPRPWSEGENIPWDEPEFSARMLREHLSQAHDRASRREQIIDRQVTWIHRDLLEERPTAVLDLGCGPGLYTSRFACLGHRCLGLDYGPAAIAYALERAVAEGLTCQYELRDIRSGAYGTNGFGLAMLIYGELNVFPRDTAVRILRGMREALVEHGVLLLEAHTREAVRQMGECKPEWYTAEHGLFGDDPYLCLAEHFWHPELQASTIRSFVVETATGAMRRYAQTFQAYSEQDYRELLTAAGFTEEITLHAGLAGEHELVQAGLCAITVRKEKE
jgi:SAM-dependent methyltransferase